MYQRKTLQLHYSITDFAALFAYHAEFVRSMCREGRLPKGWRAQKHNADWLLIADSKAEIRTLLQKRLRHVKLKKAHYSQAEETMETMLKGLGNG